MATSPTQPDDLGMTRFRLGDVELLVLHHAVPSVELLDALTPSQRAIVALALDGSSNRDIALRRRLSEGAVAKHLAAARRRLGVASRAELAALIAARSPGGR